MWDEISYPFLNFNNCTSIKNFHPTYYDGYDYLSMLEWKLIHVSRLIYLTRGFPNQQMYLQSIMPSQGDSCLCRLMFYTIRSGSLLCVNVHTGHATCPQMHYPDTLESAKVTKVNMQNRNDVIFFLLPLICYEYASMLSIPSAIYNLPNYNGLNKGKLN